MQERSRVGRRDQRALAMLTYGVDGTILSLSQLKSID